MRDRLLDIQDQKALLAYCDHVLLVDLSSKEVVPLVVEHPPSNAGKGAPVDPDPDAVESVALSPRAPLATAVYRNKTLALWSTGDGGKLVAQRVLPKKATSVLFAPASSSSTAANELLVVADKVGEVRAYPATEALPRESALLLGHTASIITSMDLLQAAAPSLPGVLATADRDEKVRLSSFPHTCIIDGFCTGHSKYVTTVRFAGPAHLVSGGGDGQLFLWEARNGAEVASTTITTNGDKEGGGEAPSLPPPPQPSGPEKKEEEEEEEEEAPCSIVHLLAVSPDGRSLVVSTRGSTVLQSYSLPSLDRRQQHVVPPLPSCPLAMHFSEAGVLYVSVEAPTYLLAYKGLGGEEGAAASVQEVGQEQDPLVAAVRAYGLQQSLKTQVHLEEFDARGELQKMALNRKFSDREAGEGGGGSKQGWKQKKKQKHKKGEEGEGEAVAMET